jgi:predicted kinase
MPKPMCIIVTGRPGAGKTTLAKQLGQRLYLPVIHRDEIKEGYVNTFGVSHGQLPDVTNQVVTDFFFEVVRHYLSKQISMIAEAAFQHKLWAHGVPIWAPMSRLSILICTVEAEVAAQRHVERGSGMRSVSSTTAMSP